ncbi:stringent starvation protein A (fragment) [uncultured Thiomicrorhabdus sp.]
MLRQIETEWYPLVETITYSEDEAEVKTARRDLQERLIQMIPAFSHKDFFMSDDYSLVDISMSVLLWRLPFLGIDLPKSAKPIMDYAEKVLEREMFAESLSDDELDMRD